MTVRADQIRAWREIVESAETDALLAGDRDSRRALHFKLVKLAAEMHEAELNEGMAEARALREATENAG